MTIEVPKEADLGSMGKLAVSYSPRCAERNILMDGYQQGVPGTVWSDATLIKAYLNDVYGGLAPGWPLGGGASSDEGINGSGVNLGDYQQGILAVSKTFRTLAIPM